MVDGNRPASTRPDDRTAADAGPVDGAPVQVAILYGALRSGTTLLRLMLDGHAAIACPGETDYLFDHISRGPDGWTYDAAALAMDRIFRAAGLDHDPGQAGDVALAGFLEQLAGGPLGRDKTLVLVLHRELEKAAALLPGAQLIELMRDPRDVARSAIGMGWAGNTYYGVDHWTASFDGLIAARGDFDRPPHRLAYETLAAEPEATLAALCHSLGHDYDPAMLRYPERSTYTNPDASLVEQWRRKQTPAEVGLVEGKIGHRLQAAGYVPSGQMPRAPGAVARLRLRTQDRVYRQRFLFKRYGWDYVALELAQALRLRQLAQAAELRIQQKTLAYLK